MLGLTEEVSLVRRQQIDHDLPLVRVLLLAHVSVVRGERVESVVIEPARQPTGHQILLPVREADPREIEDQLLELDELDVGNLVFDGWWVGLQPACHGGVPFCWPAGRLIITLSCHRCLARARRRRPLRRSTKSG